MDGLHLAQFQLALCELMKCIEGWVRGVHVCEGVSVCEGLNSDREHLQSVVKADMLVYLG